MDVKHNERRRFCQAALPTHQCACNGSKAYLLCDWVIVWLSGGQDDLEKVTKMAYDQIRSYGMDEVVGILSFPTAAESGFIKPYSRKLQATIDEVL